MCDLLDISSPSKSLSVLIFQVFQENFHAVIYYCSVSQFVHDFLYPLLDYPSHTDSEPGHATCFGQWDLSKCDANRDLEGCMHWSFRSLAALWNSHTSLERSLVKPTGEGACGADVMVYHCSWDSTRPSRPSTTRHVSEVILGY